MGSHAWLCHTGVCAFSSRLRWRRKGRHAQRHTSPCHIRTATSPHRVTEIWIYCLEATLRRNENHGHMKVKKRFFPKITVNLFTRKKFADNAKLFEYILVYFNNLYYLCGDNNTKIVVNLKYEFQHHF